MRIPTRPRNYCGQPNPPHRDVQVLCEGRMPETAAAPEQRAVYFALYKFYFYKYRLDDAERVALMALEISARQGGFSAVWETLTPLSTQWGKTDTPQHFFLFSLKALAFIRLRLGNIQGCHAILNKLRELDPIDQVGSSVILDLANRFTV